MDFKVPPFDGFAGPLCVDADELTPYSNVSPKQPREKWKTEDMANLKAMHVLRSNSMFVSSESEPEGSMLSFSSASSPHLTISFLTGNGGGMSDASLHGGNRGTFTSNQWMELEQQALIFKYIASNVPVPSSLLFSIKKSLHPCFLSGSTSSSSSGWSKFHLGYVGSSTDPEPGRCRRTDGKKWRCSRDAVADHKYCERHMNRGRHRSRKPVEGQTQTGQAPTATATKKAAPVISSSVATSGIQFKKPISAMSEQVKEKSSTEISGGTQQLEENSSIHFGLVASESLFRHSQRSFKNCDVHPLQLLIDDNSCTKLSMSTPACMDFPSLTSPALDFDADESTKKQSSWVPISWSNSMGGPLGEALTTRVNNKNLNFMADGHELGASPTGVLHKTTLSNSSSGSSSRSDSKRSTFSSSPIPL